MSKRVYIAGESEGKPVVIHARIEAGQLVIDEVTEAEKVEPQR